MIKVNLKGKRVVQLISIIHLVKLKKLYFVWLADMLLLIIILTKVIILLFQFNLNISTVLYVSWYN